MLNKEASHHNKRLRVPGLKTIKRIRRQWRSKLSACALILGYHRILYQPDDPLNMCIQPDYFAAQMSYIRNHMTPLPLDELVGRSVSNGLPKHAVAVTFDDGYIDNLEIALPILEQFEIPATLFVTTGPLGKTFWWDQITRWYKKAPLTRLQNETPALYRPTLLAYYDWLLPFSHSTRQEYLQALWHVSGYQPDVPPSIMTAGEIVQLAQSPLITIGAHTVTHPLLDMLSPAEQAYEIGECRRYLEEITGQSVRSFSYPNGRYTPETLSIVEQSGYHFACCSFPDAVYSHSNPFHLPRIWAENKPPPKFADHWI